MLSHPMEISAFSPYTDDYLSSNLFSFVQELDSLITPDNNDSNKRKRIDQQPSNLPITTSTNVIDSSSLFQDMLNPFLNFEKQEQDDSIGFFSTLGSMRNQPEKNYNVSSAPASKRARRASPEDGGGSAEAAAAGGGSLQRRLWVKSRSNEWWEQCNSPDFPEEEFKKAFRMSRATFDMICNELEPSVNKKNTMLRQAIPVRQRVAVCIWRLATGEPLREVSKRFGLGISTCHKLVLEVCSAIKDVLMPKFLQWPNEEKMREIKGGFELVSGMHDIGGSIYTTHIPIIAPKVSVQSYFNKRHTERYQKTSYSITVQGVVDHKGVFTDICVGYPGSMTDDKVLENSALYQRASRGLLRDILIVGNAGFPLLDWVLVPYNRINLTWTQHGLNGKVDEVQSIAKEAFMRLKARWSCLQKRTEGKLQDLPNVLGACCVLHNICEMRNEGISPELRFDLFDDETVLENPVGSMNAARVRDQIAHKLLHHNLAGTTFFCSVEKL